MKVGEVLAKLKAFDPQLDVLCYCEDDEILAQNHGFRIFDITGIEVTEAEKRRAEDGVTSLKLGKSDHSSSHVLIEITADI